MATNGWRRSTGGREPRWATCCVPRRGHATTSLMGTPVQLEKERHGRDARATRASAIALCAVARLAPVRRLLETCHSTKRTHFILSLFSMYQFYLQELMRFAVAFAN